MRTYKTEGIVIKRKNFKEADRILTIITSNSGKIQAKAPGVRRINSRRSSHMELLNRSIFTLYQSHKSLYPIVTEAQVLEDFSSIKKDLEKIGLSYYICELIDRLCPQNQENRRVFFLLKDTLFRLAGTRHSGDHRFVGETPEYLRNLHDKGDSGRARMTEREELFVIENFENDLLVALGFLPTVNYIKNKYLYIEEILERKLYTKRFLPAFLQRV